MFKRFLKSDLGKGTFMLFITMNIFNLLNFVFHFSMGRLLGPSDYGILAVLMSLIYIYNVPVETLQNLVSRYTSTFNLNKEYNKIKYLIVKVLKKGFNVSLILFLLLILASVFLASFLDVNFWLIIIANTYIFFAFSNPVLRGVLQGRKKFSAFGFSLVIESVFKISLAVLFVLLGIKVFGAIIGVILGSLISLIFAVYFNIDVLEKKQKKVYFEKIYSKSATYLITIFVIFFIFSLDILLAKRFFPIEVVGQYSVLSILGKMIFLGTLAISKAMFPVVSEKHDGGKSSKTLLKKSFLIVSLLCFVSVLAFLIIPKFIIWILYGSQYLGAAPYLVYSGLAFSFLSLGNLIFIYALSTNKLKKPYLLFTFVFITPILLFLFHENIFQYILAFMISNLLLFISSLFFILKK